MLNCLYMSDVNTKEILEAITVFAESVDRRFNAVDARFNAVDARLNAVDSHLDEMSTRIDETNQRIDRLYTLVDGFIQLHQKLDLELTALRSMYQRLEDRIQKLEVQRA